jgi:hypothetical protein
VALLDELDRAAARFSDVAIVKRWCDPTAHWANTSYRFSLDPKWNNNLLTLCIQYNLMPYTRQKLFPGVLLSPSGRPSLAFAMTSPGSNSSSANLFDKGRISCNAPQLKVVKLPLDRRGSKRDRGKQGDLGSLPRLPVHTRNHLGISILQTGQELV